MSLDECDSLTKSRKARTPRHIPAGLLCHYMSRHQKHKKTMDPTWSDEVHRSRYAAEVAVAHEEIYLKKQSLPVPNNNAAKSGGPFQSLLVLGGLGAFAVLKFLPNVEPALKRFMQDHPVLWHPVNELFKGGGRSVGGASHGHSQPKAPRGGREAASKAAKAAAQAAAARAAAAGMASAPLKASPVSSSANSTSSTLKVPATQNPSSSRAPSSKPAAAQPSQSSQSKQSAQEPAAKTSKKPRSKKK